MFVQQFLTYQIILLLWVYFDFSVFSDNWNPNETSDLIYAILARREAISVKKVKNPKKYGSLVP